MRDMAQLVRKCLCCCLGSGEDDNGPPYEPLHDEHVNSVRPRNNEGFSGSDEADSSGSNGHKMRSKKQMQEEELKKIIEKTQDRIIDVTHLDDRTRNGLDNASRQKQYEEVIRAHDSRVKSQANGGPSNSKSTATPKVTSLGRPLLEDSGNRVANYLTKTGLTGQAVAEVHEYTEKMREAVDSMTISCQKQLVVHMV